MSRYIAGNNWHMVRFLAVDTMYGIHVYFLCCLLHWFCIDTIATGIDLLERTVKLLLLEVNDICRFFTVCRLIGFKLQ